MRAPRARAGRLACPVHSRLSRARFGSFGVVDRSRVAHKERQKDPHQQLDPRARATNPRVETTTGAPAARCGGGGQTRNTRSRELSGVERETDDLQTLCVGAPDYRPSGKRHVRVIKPVRKTCAGRRTQAIAAIFKKFCTSSPRQVPWVRKLDPGQSQSNCHLCPRRIAADHIVRLRLLRGPMGHMSSRKSVDASARGGQEMGGLRVSGGRSKIPLARSAVAEPLADYSVRSRSNTSLGSNASLG